MESLLLAITYETSPIGKKRRRKKEKKCWTQKTAARGTEPKKKAQTLITMTSGTEPMTPTILLNRIKDF